MIMIINVDIFVHQNILFFLFYVIFYVDFLLVIINRDRSLFLL
jgi:hypothetical protein